MYAIDYFMVGLMLLLFPQIIRNFKQLFCAITEGIAGIIELFQKCREAVRLDRRICTQRFFDVEVKHLEDRIKSLDDVSAVALSSIHDRIDDLKSRIEDMRHSQNVTIARWGIVIAVCICAVQVVINFVMR